jgi:hypothetical protein
MAGAFLASVWPLALGGRFAHFEVFLLRPALAVAFATTLGPQSLGPIDVRLWIAGLSLACVIVHVFAVRFRSAVPLLAMLGWSVPILAHGSGQSPIAVAFLLEIAFAAMRLAPFACIGVTVVACSTLAELAIVDSHPAGARIALVASACMLLAGTTFYILVRSFRSTRTPLEALEVAYLVHGIKNSLSGVAGFAQLLDSDLEPNDPRRRWTQRMRSGLDEAHQRLVDLARPPAKPAGDRAQETLLVAAVERVLERSAGLLARRHVLLFKDIPADLRISMSAIALETIMQDLILNAIEAMPESGGVLEIAADSDPPRLRVRDSGHGVDPAIRPVIFQVGWSSKGGGRGLGLSRVRSIAEASGASICVRTGPLGGAEFELEFQPRQAFMRR